MRLDPFEENPEIERLPIVAGMRFDANTARRRGEALCVGPQRVGGGRQQVDAAVLAKCLCDADFVRRQPGVGALPAPRQRRRSRRLLAGAQQAHAILGQLAPGGTGAVPFEHRKFGMMGAAALAIAVHVP